MTALWMPRRATAMTVFLAVAAMTLSPEARAMTGSTAMKATIRL